MLEDIVEFVVKPAGIYVAVNSTLYLLCLRNSLKQNTFVTDWKDHMLFGADRFKSIYGSRKYAIFTFSYLSWYYHDRLDERLTEKLTEILTPLWNGIFNQ